MSKKDKAKRKRAAERKAKSELKSRLLSYSIVAGAALIGAPYADAGVVYSGPQDITVNSTTPSVDIDMDGAGPMDFNFHWLRLMHRKVFGLIEFEGAGPASETSWRNELKIHEIGSNSIASTGSASTSAYASKFDRSFYVGGTTGSSWESSAKLLAHVSGYGASITSSSGNFVGAKGFIGVRFNNGDGLKHGWIEFEGAADASWGHITGWAYEDSGDSIHVGDTGADGEPIPEPGGLALLAMGAAGLAMLRKKRQAA